MGVRALSSDRTCSGPTAPRLRQGRPLFPRDGARGDEGWYSACRRKCHPGRPTGRPGISPPALDRRDPGSPLRSGRDDMPSLRRLSSQRRDRVAAPSRGSQAARASLNESETGSGAPGRSERSAQRQGCSARWRAGRPANQPPPSPPETSRAARRAPHRDWRR